MYSFKFHHAKNLQNATELLASNTDAKLLAGGQSLLASMKLRLNNPSALIDLKGIEELVGIEILTNEVFVGAMTRHAQVAGSIELQNVIPGLHHLAGSIADRMVRNMGTLGGSLANSDPSADYPAATLALNSTIFTNQRSIPADDFFKGLFQTALNEHEIITKVRFLIPKRSAYVKFKHPASRYAVVGVFIADFGHEVRVAVTGAASCVFRHAAMESALSKEMSVDSISDIMTPTTNLNCDIFADEEYRSNLITRMAIKAVEKINHL
jgi:carbon-monoxide dehydrogenase medium subunit